MPSYLKKVTQADPPTQKIPDAVPLKQPKNTERSSPKNSGGEVKKGRYFDLPLPNGVGVRFLSGVVASESKWFQHTILSAFFQGNIIQLNV